MCVRWGRADNFERKRSCTDRCDCKIATIILTLSFVDCVWFGRCCCVVADSRWAIVLYCTVLGGQWGGFVKHIFGAQAWKIKVLLKIIQIYY